MSKTAADCCICAVEPATDRFGWCDRCADLYDQPAEPTAADLAESHRTYLNALFREIVLAQVAANGLSRLTPS